VIDPTSTKQRSTVVIGGLATIFDAQRTRFFGLWTNLIGTCHKPAKFLFIKPDWYMPQTGKISVYNDFAAQQ